MLRKVKNTNGSVSIISEGCVIKGQLDVESDMQVDGVVDGKLNVAGVLTVSPSGRVKGEISARTLLASGIVKGECCVEFLSILKPGKVSGTIMSNNLSIEPGGEFLGEVKDFPADKVVKVIDTKKNGSASGKKLSAV